MKTSSKPTHPFKQWSSVRLNRGTSGRIIAYCNDPKCSAGAPTGNEALEKLRGEIRYRLEYCPCSRLHDNNIELDIVAGTELV